MCTWAAPSTRAFMRWGLPLILAEWVAHYHIDWAKGRWSDRTCHTPADAGFWRAMGADQALHQMTYLAMAWGWVVWS